MELSEFNIRYEPHGPIKAQCLLDFINDLQQTPIEDQWTLHVDGSSNPRGAGADIVLESPNDILIEKSLHFAFKTSNNQAEYEAILVGLSLDREVGVKRLTCKTDSNIRCKPNISSKSYTKVSVVIIPVHAPWLPEFLEPGTSGRP